ncbi:MAG: radical SAM-associated putative lipoprotein, partial [Tannerella sp.]|nr:radical SAM-associated putative lipoprotein [Tannerella sp.]
MKKFNRKFIKGTNWALAGLLSLLGFSSCDIINGGAEEYGTPYAEFVVSGKVTDSDNRGLQGIGVIVSKADHYQRATSGFIPDRNIITHEILDTFRTKENGNFEYSYNGFPVNDSINIFMKFEDLSENVRYEADSVKVTFFSSELKGGKGWYEGKAEKKI